MFYHYESIVEKEEWSDKIQDIKFSLPFQLSTFQCILHRQGTFNLDKLCFFFFLMPFIVYLLPCCSAHACIKEHTQICFCFHPNRCLISTSQASFLLKVTMRQALAYLFPLWAVSRFRLTVQKQPGPLHPSMLFLPLCTL